MSRNYVLDVCNALNSYLIDGSIDAFNELVQETAKYILDLYPDIRVVRSKFETEQPDFNPDLLLTLSNDVEIKVNLFRRKGKAAIQPKNLGAKSFLEKYFLSEKLQDDFNAYLAKEYDLYLQGILDSNGYRNVYDRTPAMKRKVAAQYPKFEDEINSMRKGFLFSIREYCFK